jgi:hypothetical protein
MKKKNLKSLRLNKKPVSSLNPTTINGGAIDVSEVIGCVSGGNNPAGITDHCVSVSCPSQAGGNCHSWLVHCESRTGGCGIWD